MRSIGPVPENTYFDTVASSSHDLLRMVGTFEIYFPSPDLERQINFCYQIFDMCPGEARNFRLTIKQEITQEGARLPGKEILQPNAYSTF